jgi:hypothetical protein
LRKVWGLVLLPLTLAACASPGDVEASHARALGEAQEKLAQAQQGVDNVQRGYESDLASAKEWDVHMFGIPASGWMVLLIIGAVLAAVLLGWGIYLVRQAGDQRRILVNNREKRAHELALAKEKTRQAELAAQKAEYDSVQRYVPPPLSRAE